MTALEQYRIFNQISVIAIVGETFAPPGSTLATLRRGSQSPGQDPQLLEYPFTLYS